jgi:hypothetical protein
MEVIRSPVTLVPTCSCRWGETMLLTADYSCRIWRQWNAIDVKTEGLGEKPVSVPLPGATQKFGEFDHKKVNYPNS